MDLAVPLRQSQITAATNLHAKLKTWRRIDDALSLLAESATGFSPEETLLKAVTINALYGTNVVAIYRVAEHVGRVLKKADLDAAGPELVEKMAHVPVGGTETKVRRRYSFAAKFAHFFIDSDRFPIYDKYAKQMVNLHLGRKQRAMSKTAPYVAFATNVTRLIEHAELECSGRQLDHYLWIAGQLRAWRRGQRINAEVQERFKASSVRTLDQIWCNP